MSNGTLERLLQQGFDLSTYDDETGYCRLRCSQCEALAVNGVACHEHGCPNIVRDYDEDEGERYDEDYDDEDYDEDDDT